MRPVEKALLRAVRELAPNPASLNCSKPDSDAKYRLRSCALRARGSTTAPFLESLYLWSPWGKLRVLEETAGRLRAQNQSGTADRLRLRPTDTLVLNFGQHPASQHHWHASRYARALDEVLAEVAALTATHRRGEAPLVVWTSTPAFPLRCEGPVVQKKDWRTEPRLLLFNALASAAMRRRSVPIFDYHALTWPLSHVSKDHSHFISTAFMQAAGRLLLSTICADHIVNHKVQSRGLRGSRRDEMGSIDEARLAYGSGAESVLECS